LPDQIVQVGHACLEAGRRFQPDDGCHLVVLTVADQIELAQVIDRLAAIDIRCAAFYFFFNDTATTEIYTEVHTLSLHDAPKQWWQEKATDGQGAGNENHHANQRVEIASRGLLIRHG
jgi:hypothetical protein